MADFVAPGSPATRLVAQLRAKPPKKKKAPANKPPAPPVPAGPAPGTIDPVTGFITTATSTGRRRRDLTAEIQTQFANVAAMVTTTETFDRVHFRPIALSTQEKLDIAKRLWTEWFTLLYASVEKAEATLAKDAPFPPLAEVKHFIYFLATKGKSGLGVEQGGWSMHTTRTFLGRIFSMLRRCFTKEPPKYDRTQLYSAISNWAFVDKALTTRKRPKRIVREVDLVELLAVALKTSVKISSNFSRITIMGLITYLFTHGHRIGSLVEAKGYEGRGEHLKWRDIEFVAYGWDPEAGLGIQQFAVMHWCKGMRFDESLNVTTNMRNLGRSRIHIDPCLLIEALAVQADVFEQDLLVLRATDPALLEFPFTLKMKKSALDQPVFLNAEKTGALTENAAYHLLVKLRKALNWSNFVFTTLRYSYASTMTDRVPKTHLRYLMGHTRGSSLSITTYQAPDRPVDISGSRFDEEGAHFAAMAPVRPRA
ncbi:hypothetical protein C8R46DRAFT_478045 [Mycena filopes]|nr:hypothetical protein C8R46DRAFT_478045 [Mycena filopes]